MKPLSVSDIQDIYDTLTAMPPMPVAVWLIDRPDAYNTILEALLKAQVSVDGKRLKNDVVMYNSTYPGISVYMLDSNIDELPDAFQEKGVWVEMSKGPHLKLDM